MDAVKRGMAGFLPFVFSLILIICLFVAFNPSFSFAQTEEEHLRQHEFIVHLTNAMGIEHLLPKSPTIHDYIKLLQARGISIPGGYKPDEYITTKQMAIMMVPAMGLEKTRFLRIKSEISEKYRNRAIIIDVIGEVKYKLKDSEQWLDAKPGVILTAEDTVRTGKGSKLILRVGQVSIVTIKDDTVLTLYNLSKEPTLYIEKGEIILDTHGAEKETPYHIVTPTTTSAVRGTILHKIVRRGITREICYKGKLLEYDFSPIYTYEEIIDMIIAGTLNDILTEGWVEVPSGYYYLEGEIFPASSEELEDTWAEAEESNITAETDLDGEASIDLLIDDDIWSGDDKDADPEEIDEDLDKTFEDHPPDEVVEDPSTTTDRAGSGEGTGTVEPEVPTDEEAAPEGITEPTPPVAPEAPTEKYWVNPTGDSPTYGDYTIARNGQDVAGNNGSNEQPWATIGYALTRVTGSTIHLVEATHSGNNLNMKNGVHITGYGVSIIDGGDGNTVIVASGVTCTLTNVTIQNGSYAGNGGGIYVYNGASLTLADCTVTSNDATGATGYGGGIYVDGTSTLNADSCTISSNTAGDDGGGVFVASGGAATFTGTTVTGNQASGPGGGIYHTGAGALRFGTGTVTSNTATRGGGFYMTSSSDVQITRSRFTDNEATTWGSALSFNNCTSGSALLENCIVASNGADGTNVRGAIEVKDCNVADIVTIRNCTITANDTGLAASGAIYLDDSSDPDIYGCIINGNDSYGIYENDGCDPDIDYCCLYKNTGTGIGGADYFNFGDTGCNGDAIDAIAGVDNCNNRYHDPLLNSDYKHTNSTANQITDIVGMTGPNVDIAGNSRPLDGGSGFLRYDLGAYERTPGGDPPITGKVYDSVTGENISSPVVAIYREGIIEPLSRTTSNPYTFNVDPGNYYIAVAKSGYAFPSQIVSSVTAGDHGDVFTAADDPLTIDIPMDPDGWLVIEKTVNKKRATVGEIVTYSINIKNKHWFKSIENVELTDKIVNGFKYVTGSTYQGTTQQTDPTVSAHTAVFDLGTISANTTINLSYQVRVGSGISPGRYKAEAYTRKSTTGERNSNKSNVSVDVIEDPLFTRGTIIGKVFNDIDGNGIQGSGEYGISEVKIYTEYGVVVETDEDGKYHIADVPDGNHLLKVDPISLKSQVSSPKVTTDNPYYVKITEGLLAKVNFGISYSEKTPPLVSNETKQGGPTPLRKIAEQFFIVALAEGIVRDLDTSGNMEMVSSGKDDRYDDGVRVDGRLALYLKGKVLGKFLITASVDTERRPYEGRYDTGDLFTNLDPDKYYPVYGDASKIDYAGVDTQDVVYVLIEWDESFAQWGSFHTEFPLYKRTLSGGLINYESVGKTKFGDPWTKIRGFGAISRQRAAHDEFVGTGGSLYYLRHDDVVEGSEKVQVEVRDRIGRVIISTIILSEEKDYEIDYDRGRIILRKPLNSIQQQYVRSIISNDILMGERVYLVVDYEYISERMSDQAWGVKASQQIGHHIRIGSQYVEEQKPGDPYRLAGGDATIKINENTVIDGSYTHTEETQLGSGISYDGGLSFGEQQRTHSDGKSGSAVNVSGRTKLFDNTNVYLSYNRQDPYYSVTDSISTQGSRKYIARVNSNLTDNLSVGVEHITQELFENTIAGTTIGARDTHTTTGMLDYERGRWDIRAEYQHQEVDNPISEYTYLGMLPLLDNDFIAGRIGYQLFSWLHPYIRGQVTLNGDANDQGTVGADIKLWEDTSINVAETIGTLGNSTALGVTTKFTEDTDVYANLELGNHMMLGRYTKSTYGQSTRIRPGGRVYVEEDYSSYRENVVRGSVLGYDREVGDTMALGLTYERSNVENNTQVINRDAGSITLSYLNTESFPIGKQAKARSKIEVRNDIGTTEVRQWLMENDILWRVTEGITLSTRGNWGWTSDLDQNTDEAEFYELGAGFSLRPVTWDRLNILGKYSYIMNLPPDSQWDFISTTETRRHVYAIEGLLDVFKYLQLVGKFAYRDLEEKVGPRDWTESDTYLYIARTNFHIMNSEPDKPFLLRGWDFAVEYRVLENDQIKDSKEGFLVELDKDLGNYLRCGVGYNFTDYDDDLRNEDEWDAEGWFVKLSGKY